MQLPLYNLQFFMNMTGQSLASQQSDSL